MPDNLVTWVFNDGFVPLSKITCEGNYSIISDYLGTPVEAYDEDGNRVWSAELDIYGRVNEFTGEKDFIPFRYQGQYEDVEIGLYYNRFRYYDPEQGNYTQIDPIGLSGNNPTLYGYVHDPLTWIDPLGLTAKILGQNMAAAGRPLAPGQTPHHAVKENANNVYAHGSRDILDKHGLNPDIAENGARLWGTHPNQKSQPGHPGAAKAKEIGNYHGGTHIHGKKNDKLIYKILKNADKRGLDIKNVLSDITGRMESGSWKKTFTARGGKKWIYVMIKK